MVKLRVKVSKKEQMVISKVIRDKLGIKPGKYLLIDEKNGRIIIERYDIGEFVKWLKENRKKLTKDVYKFSLEDEFE